MRRRSSKQENRRQLIQNLLLNYFFNQLNTDTSRGIAMQFFFPLITKLIYKQESNPLMI